MPGRCMFPPVGWQVKKPKIEVPAADSSARFSGYFSVPCPLHVHFNGNVLKFHEIK